MKRIFLMLTAVALYPALSFAQTPASLPTPPGAQAGPTTGTARPSQPVSAVLEKDVDTRRVKVGDAIRATAFSGFAGSDGTKIPPGSTLIGHVTEASRLGKGSIESRLGVVFDQAQLHSGQTVPLHMGIVGLAEAPRVSGPEIQSDMMPDITSQYPGNQTGGRVDPRTVGGSTAPRSSRGAPIFPRYPITMEDAAGRPADRSPRVERPAGVASVGSTVPGIALKGTLAKGLMLVSTSDSIALRSGTPLVLTVIVEPPPR